MFTIITGIKRGVFSNEAGMGSGAHAAATTDSEFPIEQGYIQAFGVYVTTLFICTITAFLIMVTDAISVADNYSNGIELTQYALTSLFGPIGGIIKTNHVLFLVRIIVIVVIIISACASAGLIWSLVDIGVGLTATINIIALCYLASEVKKRLRKLP